MKYGKLFISLFIGTSLMAFPSCNGILEDIYDEPQKDLYGFKEVATSEKIGTIYVNSSEYTRWIYMDFHRAEIDSAKIVNGGEEYVGEWDIAVHRWDTKTNEGRVMETSYTDLNDLVKAQTMPEGIFVADLETDSTIIIDTSQMVDGIIGYTKGKVNPVLSQWLNVDTSTMPPIYTLNNKVYVIELKDGTKAAVQLSNYMNAAYTKGYLTINYVYPLGF